MEKLVFALNGERYEVSDVDPSMPLLEFIRTRTRFKGPKLGCGEGTDLQLFLSLFCSFFLSLGWFEFFGDCKVVVYRRSVWIDHRWICIACYLKLSLFFYGFSRDYIYQNSIIFCEIEISNCGGGGELFTEISPLYFRWQKLEGFGLKLLMTKISPFQMRGDKTTNCVYRNLIWCNMNWIMYL